MEVTREMLIKKVAEESDYYQKDVKNVFNALENVIIDCFEGIDDDERVSVRLLSYLAINGYVVPKRERVDPRDRTPIVCDPTVKLSVRCSDGFKDKVQKIYDKKKAE